MIIFASLLILIGLLCLGRWYYLKKQRQQKEFVVFGAVLLSIWLFPGATLIIIGLVLIALLS
jgi:hypothetical protein